MLIQVDEYELFLTHKKLKKVYPSGKLKAKRKWEWIRIYTSEVDYPVKRTKLDYLRVANLFKWSEEEVVRRIIEIFRGSKTEIAVLCKDALISDIWSFERVFKKLIKQGYRKSRSIE